MIIVTGSSGFIGSALVRRLRSKRINVQCYDIVEHSPAKYCIPFVEKAKAVYHLSCLTQEMAQRMPHISFDTNSYDCYKIAAACAEHKVPLIYTSSASVYGNSSILHTESELPRPLSHYAIHKLAGEHYVASTEGLDYCILRLSNVYGPGQTPNNPYCGFIGKAFAAARDGKAIKVIGDGSQTRDFTYIEDVVDAMVACAARHTSIKPTFNICSSETYSVRYVAELIGRITGAKVEYGVPLREIDRVKKRRLSSEKANEFLLDKRTTLKEGIILTAKWWGF